MTINHRQYTPRAGALLSRSVLFLLTGCGTVGDIFGDGGADLATAGPDLAMAPNGSEYYKGPESAALGGPGNQSTCATCHTVDGTPKSGATFKDIAYKTSYKGGSTDLLGAANACVTGWMGGNALKADDAPYIGLRKYLESISDKAKTTPNQIAPEVLDDQAMYEAAYAGGNAAAGAARYAAVCADCHDKGLKIGAKTPLAKAELKGKSLGRIAQQVRTSGPPPSGRKDATDSTPGPMPFFEVSDLSVQDLKDIIAHVKM